MICLLVCRCANADVRGKKFLKDHGMDEWEKVSTYVGRDKASEFLEQFPNGEYTPDQPGALRNVLHNTGSYVVILGYDDNRFMWSDISHSDARSIVDAELIIEQFA